MSKIALPRIGFMPGFDYNRTSELFNHNAMLSDPTMIEVALNMFKELSRDFTSIHEIVWLTGSTDDNSEPIIIMKVPKYHALSNSMHTYSQGNLKEWFRLCVAQNADNPMFESEELTSPFLYVACLHPNYPKAQARHIEEYRKSEGIGPEVEIQCEMAYGCPMYFGTSQEFYDNLLPHIQHAKTAHLFFTDTDVPDFLKHGPHSDLTAEELVTIGAAAKKWCDERAIGLGEIELVTRWDMFNAYEHRFIMRSMRSILVGFLESLKEKD